MTAQRATPPDHRDDPSNAPHAQPPKHDDLGFTIPEPTKLSGAKVAFVAGAIAVVLGGAFLARWLPNRHARAELEAQSTEAGETTKRVEVVKPTEATSDRALELPGTVSALEETIVYARANGYVRKWSVDIGDKVAEGALLAEIETPELDQQVLQARAQLAQAEASMVQSKANAVFSKQNAARYETLQKQGIASQEDLEKNRAQADVDQASVAVAGANVAAQRANIDHLVQLKAFAKVTAPFAGTITARTVERGALVTEGTSPLFKVTATDPVRVFVQVPQDLAPSVRADMPATIRVREFPNRNFDGKVARTAGALDPATRTMLVEIRIPNPKGELLTGMYAQASLTLPTSHRVFSIPATALLNDATGLHVAVVGADNRVHLEAVTMERDTGSTVEIASGINGSERIVKLPGVEMTEGLLVDVANK